MKTGQIVEGRGGLYTVQGEDEARYVVRAKNKLRHEGLTPLVGDRVHFLPGTGEEHGWLADILPRTSVCVRPPVANVEVLCIVAAPVPQPDWLLVDKLLAACRRGGIAPLLVINKMDVDEGAYLVARQTYRGADVPILAVSAQSGQGLEALRQALSGRLCAFAGQSGVGKSRLLGALLGMALQSGGLSQRIERGRQTTRHTALLASGGLRVLDTPGFSLLELPQDLPPQELSGLYPECAPYAGKCRFNPCLHDAEPDCAVQKAMLDQALDAQRLERYRVILNQLRTQWRNRYD